MHPNPTELRLQSTCKGEVQHLFPGPGYGTPGPSTSYFHLFPLSAEQNLTVSVDHILTICPSVLGHLGCSRILAIVNEAAMSTHTQVSLW